MSNLKLNEQITFLRKEKGVTQEELANVLGVTNQAVSKWESAQCCPDIQLLPELADYFGVSIDELMGHKVKGIIKADTEPFPVDPKLESAIIIAKEAGKISTSILQRKLCIGYGRSKSIIEKMESLEYIIKADDIYSYIWIGKNIL